MGGVLDSCFAFGALWISKTSATVMGTCMFVDYIHVHVEDFRDYVLQTNLSVFCSWGLSGFHTSATVMSACMFVDYIPKISGTMSLQTNLSVY